MLPRLESTRYSSHPPLSSRPQVLESSRIAPAGGYDTQTRCLPTRIRSRTSKHSPRHSSFGNCEPPDCSRSIIRRSTIRPAVGIEKEQQQLLALSQSRDGYSGVFDRSDIILVSCPVFWGSNFVLIFVISGYQRINAPPLPSKLAILKLGCCQSISVGYHASALTQIAPFSLLASQSLPSYPCTKLTRIHQTQHQAHSRVACTFFLILIFVLVTHATSLQGACLTQSYNVIGPAPRSILRIEEAALLGHPRSRKDRDSAEGNFTWNLTYVLYPASFQKSTIRLILLQVLEHGSLLNVCAASLSSHTLYIRFHAACES